jgi:hypothetical protein
VLWAKPESLLAPNLGAPIGREKVITCFGIVGIVTLATSKLAGLVLPTNEALAHQYANWQPISLSSSLLERRLAGSFRILSTWQTTIAYYLCRT